MAQIARAAALLAAVLLALIIPAVLLSLRSAHFIDVLSMPIYFHVLVLVALGLWSWAVDMHVLAASGIDVFRILEGSSLPTVVHSPAAQIKLPSSYSCWLSLQSAASACLATFRSADRIRSLYALALAFTAMTAVAMILFAFTASISTTHTAEIVPTITYILILACLLSPSRSLFARERHLFLRSLYRTAVGGLASHVPICDVILADILTSFSRVIGDMQLVFCDLVLSPDHPAHPSPPKLVEADPNQQQQEPNLHKKHWSVLIVPFLVLLPFLFRFRQCMAEYTQSASTVSKNRHLANAIKYMSSVPVILAGFGINMIHDSVHGVSPSQLDASQQDESKQHLHASRLTTMISIWIIFSIINTLYSIYWDVFMDWDLGHVDPIIRATISGGKAYRKLENESGSDLPESLHHSQSELPLNKDRNASPSTAVSAQADPAATSIVSSSTPQVHIHIKGSTDITDAASNTSARHARASISNPSSATSIAMSPSTQSTKHMYPFLRPTLHFVSPVPYYIAISINTLLRLSWIPKITLLYTLSESHTRSKPQGDMDTEIMKRLIMIELVSRVLEIVRRGIWLVFRIEREWVLRFGRYHQDHRVVDIDQVDVGEKESQAHT